MDKVGVHYTLRLRHDPEQDWKVRQITVSDTMRDSETCRDRTCLGRDGGEQWRMLKAVIELYCKAVLDTKFTQIHGQKRKVELVKLDRCVSYRNCHVLD